MPRHWAGASMMVAAAYLIWLAVLRRRRGIQIAARGARPPALHGSLAAMADTGPPIIIFGPVVAGGQATLAFLPTDRGSVFSPFDLAGFLSPLFAVAHRIGTQPFNVSLFLRTGGCNRHPRKRWITALQRPNWRYLSMNWEMFLSWQFGMTLVAAAAIGIWQYRSITRSRAKRGESGHVSHPPMEKGPAGDDTPLR